MAWIKGFASYSEGKHVGYLNFIIVQKKYWFLIFSIHLIYITCLMDKKNAGNFAGIFFIKSYYYTSEGFSFFTPPFTSKIIFEFSLSSEAIRTSPFFTFIFRISSAKGSSRYF